MLEWLKECWPGLLIGGILISMFTAVMFAMMHDLNKDRERTDQRVEWCSTECEDKGGWDRTTSRKHSFGGSREWICWCRDHSSEVMP